MEEETRASLLVPGQALLLTGKAGSPEGGSCSPRAGQRTDQVPSSHTAAITQPPADECEQHGSGHQGGPGSPHPHCQPQGTGTPPPRYDSSTNGKPGDPDGELPQPRGPEMAHKDYDFRFENTLEKQATSGVRRSVSVPPPTEGHPYNTGLPPEGATQPESCPPPPASLPRALRPPRREPPLGQALTTAAHGRPRARGRALCPFGARLRRLTDIHHGAAAHQDDADTFDTAVHPPEEDVYYPLFQTGDGNGRRETLFYLEHQTPHERPPPCSLPREITRGTMYVLHCFSGHRRHMDIQYWMEERARIHNLDVFVLSIDVALCPIRCDLQNPEVIGKLKSLIFGGKICALLAGPPCDTWSRARTLGLQCCGDMLQPGATCGTCRRRIPRPLRTGERLWGLGNLNKKEMIALKLANTLYRATMTLAAMAHTRGIPWLIEHPEAPTDRAHASSWRLPETTTMASIEGVETISFHQCIFGARSTKPTTLMAGHLPTLGHAVRTKGGGGRCHHGRGAHAGLRGLDGHEWRTSPAKCYPAGMCRLLGHTFMDAVKYNWPHLMNSDEANFAEISYMYQPLDMYMEQDVSWHRDTFLTTWLPR